MLGTYKSKFSPNWWKKNIVLRKSETGLLWWCRGELCLRYKKQYFQEICSKEARFDYSSSSTNILSCGKVAGGIFQSKKDTNKFTFQKLKNWAKALNLNPTSRMYLRKFVIKMLSTSGTKFFGKKWIFAVPGGAHTLFALVSIVTLK